ncbi:MAG TPA: NUDIX domain-containing protein [Ktedonobacterales bacterium]
MPPKRSTPSGDNPDEIFDLIDVDDRVIGRVRRGDAHRNPSLLHRSVQVLVFSSNGRLLLQHRSQSKDLFPDYYSASASGHVDSGEDYATAASREASEELGVSLPLTFVSKTLVHSDMETEMTAVFLARSDGPFHFHPTETQGGEFFSLEQVREARSTEKVPMTPALLAALTELERFTQERPLVTLLAAL